MNIITCLTCRVDHIYYFSKGIKAILFANNWGMRKWVIGIIFVAGVAAVVLAATLLSNSPSTGFTTLFGGKF